jgi:hypothetical protein
MRFAIVALLLCGCGSDDDPKPNETTPPPVVACAVVAECKTDEVCALPNASTKGTCVRKCTYQGDNARDSAECPVGSRCIGVTGVTVHSFCYRRCTDPGQCGIAPTGMSASCEPVQGEAVCVFRTT